MALQSKNATSRLFVNCKEYIQTIRHLFCSWVGTRNWIEYTMEKYQCICLIDPIRCLPYSLYSTVTPCLFIHITTPRAAPIPFPPLTPPLPLRLLILIQSLITVMISQYKNIIMYHYVSAGDQCNRQRAEKEKEKSLSHARRQLSATAGHHCDLNDPTIHHQSGLTSVCVRWPIKKWISIPMWPDHIHRHRHMSGLSTKH